LTLPRTVADQLLEALRTLVRLPLDAIRRVGHDQVNRFLRHRCQNVAGIAEPHCRELGLVDDLRLVREVRAWRFVDLEQRGHGVTSPVARAMSARSRRMSPSSSTTRATLLSESEEACARRTAGCTAPPYAARSSTGDAVRR